MGLHTQLLMSLPSLIKRLTAIFSGVLLNDDQHMNYAVNLRNLLDFSKPYSNTIAVNMLHFSDTSERQTSLSSQTMLMELIEMVTTLAIQ